MTRADAPRARAPCGRGVYRGGGARLHARRSGRSRHMNTRRPRLAPPIQHSHRSLLPTRHQTLASQHALRLHSRVLVAFARIFDCAAWEDRPLAPRSRAPVSRQHASGGSAGISDNATSPKHCVIRHRQELRKDVPGSRLRSLFILRPPAADRHGDIGICRA